jgi:hypothetical protein
VGVIPSAESEVIGLENCDMLDVTLWPIGELRTRQRGIVAPAART